MCNSKIKLLFKPQREIIINLRDNRFMVVNRGEGFTVHYKSDGRRKGLEKIKAGDLLGITCLFNEMDSNHNLIFYVKTTFEACLIPKQVFEKLCRENNKFACQVIANLSTRFYKLAKQNEHLALDTSTEKVLFILGEISPHETVKNICRYTHEELALMTGLNRVTVTRAINKLKRSGML